MEADDPVFVSFEAVFEPCPPGTPATPRPLGRPREVVNSSEGILVTLTPTEPDTAFAHQIAEELLGYARNRASGLSPEQLAALVQQIIAKRSA